MGPHCSLLYGLRIPELSSCSHRRRRLRDGLRDSEELGDLLLLRRLLERERPRSRLRSLPPPPPLPPPFALEISTLMFSSPNFAPSRSFIASCASRSSSKVTKAKPGGCRATHTSMTFPCFLKRSSKSCFSVGRSLSKFPIQSRVGMTRRTRNCGATP